MMKNKHLIDLQLASTSLIALVNPRNNADARRGEKNEEWRLIHEMYLRVALRKTREDSKRNQ